MADKWIQLMSEDGTDYLFPISKMDLLWENASPTSSFGAQTLNVNLGDYHWYLVKYGVSTSSVQGGLSICIKGFGGFLPADGNLNRPVGRIVTGLTDTSISFGNCTYDGNTRNDMGIPLAIYGIK